jgi:prepilin-type N-terminal cleavage/methylation domain-containing protein
MRRRIRSDRGATLIEIMISMAVVLVGMLAMFGVLRSSITGSASAQRLAQAQLRAQTVLESIRQSPNAALSCLAANSPNNWTHCETLCQAALTVKNPDGCIYTMGSFAKLHAPDVSGASSFDTTNGQMKDRTGQQYVIDQNSDADKGSWVRVGGTNGTIYDIHVVVGWNDDGGITDTNNAAYHRVVLRSGVLPNGQ